MLPHGWSENGGVLYGTTILSSFLKVIAEWGFDMILTVLSIISTALPSKIYFKIPKIFSSEFFSPNVQVSATLLHYTAQGYTGLQSSFHYSISHPKSGPQRIDQHYIALTGARQ